MPRRYDDVPPDSEYSFETLKTYVERLSVNSTSWLCLGCICTGIIVGVLSSTILSYLPIWVLAVFFIIPSILAYVSMIAAISLLVGNRNMF